MKRTIFATLFTTLALYGNAFAYIGTYYVERNGRSNDQLCEAVGSLFKRYPEMKNYKLHCVFLAKAEYPKTYHMKPQITIQFKKLYGDILSWVYDTPIDAKLDTFGAFKQKQWPKIFAKESILENTDTAVYEAQDASQKAESQKHESLKPACVTGRVTGFAVIQPHNFAQLKASNNPRKLVEANPIRCESYVSYGSRVLQCAGATYLSHAKVLVTNWSADLLEISTSIAFDLGSKPIRLFVEPKSLSCTPEG